MFEQVPENVRKWIGVVGAIGTLMLGAFTLGGSTGEIRELPARMTAVEAAQTHTDSVVHGLTEDLSEVACITRKQVLEEDPKACLLGGSSGAGNK